MKPYIILTVEQKPDHIILHTRTNNLKDIDTPEEIAMGIFNLELTCKTDTKNVLISGIIPKSDKLNVKASKGNIILRHEFNVEIYVLQIINKHLLDCMVVSGGIYI